MQEENVDISAFFFPCHSVGMKMLGQGIQFIEMLMKR